MKLLNLSLIHYITAINILFSLSFAQNYNTEEIPNPYSNLTYAELYSGQDNSLHIIGISDSVSYEDYEIHFLDLCIITRDMDGFSNKYSVIDTGQIFSGGFSGSDDVFNLSVAENISGKLLVAWTKQYTTWTDVVNYPRYYGAPLLKLGFWYGDSFNTLQEYSNEEHPQLTSDAENNFHLIRQSVTPLHNHIGSDPNYYYTTSKILYNKIHSDGTIDSTFYIGNGFLPQIHSDKNGNVHFLWLAADSSNSKYFKLMYMQRTSKGFSPAVTIKDSVSGQWDEYNVHDYPNDYYSFVDDSGRVYAGWTDNNIYDKAKIFLIILLSDSSVKTNMISGLRMLGDKANFVVSESGIAHVLWRTNANGWDYHYSQGSSGDSIFSSIKTYNSIYRWSGNPVIYINKNDKADGIFNLYSEIGYFQDLYNGKDTTLIIAKGNITYGLYSYRLPWTTVNSFVTDQSDQMWLLSSKNLENTQLVKFDLLPTGLEVSKINPEKFSLSQNYPNPFNPTTTINYQLNVKSHVKLTIYNIIGQEVKTLINQIQNRGSYSIQFNASGLASGVYIYKLKTGSTEQSRKMLLLR